MEPNFAQGFVPTEILPPPFVPYSGKRRPSRVSDQALTGTARAWLRALPPRRRPLRLCQAFPRVANRIALCWPQTTLTRDVLEDLLVDKRGNRRGFPPHVRREIQRLADFNDQHRPAEAQEGWWDAVRRIAHLD